jgi:hypothetical protein
VDNVRIGYGVSGGWVGDALRIDKFIFGASVFVFLTLKNTKKVSQCQ